MDRSILESIVYRHLDNPAMLRGHPFDSMLADSLVDELVEVVLRQNGRGLHPGMRVRFKDDPKSAGTIIAVDGAVARVLWDFDTCGTPLACLAGELDSLAPAQAVGNSL